MFCPHGEYLTATCLLCENAKLQQERYGLRVVNDSLEAVNEQLKTELQQEREDIETISKYHIATINHALELEADNAALIECVKEVARQSNNHDTTTLKMLARECLAKLGGGGDV
jgi:LPS O-antigen subunit length determinant protein (WzzB/FepE family)